MTYDQSQLFPGHDLTRLMYHRDRFAHLFRYTHVLRRLRVDMKLLDVGCGSGEMYRLFRVNRASFKQFLGLDVNDSRIYTNMATLPADGSANFIVHDIAQPQNWVPKPVNGFWDLVTCFEVLEHIPRKMQLNVLQNISGSPGFGPRTKLLLSTPCYEKGHHSKSHVVDGEICERTYQEVEDLINLAGLTVINRWGTFANQTDVKAYLHHMGLDWLWDRLHEYYDHHVLAIIFAPLIPALSRNCVWEAVL